MHTEAALTDGHGAKGLEYGDSWATKRLRMLSVGRHVEKSYFF